MAVAPSPRAINQQMMATGNRNLAEIGTARQRVATMKRDPAYDHAAAQAELDRIDGEMAAREQLLRQELATRGELEKAYADGDKPAQQAAAGKLRAQRAANKKTYGGAQTVGPCQSCTRKLDKLKSVRSFDSPEAVSDFITGVFEGKEPDYCAIADSPTDAGGLSYGKHQAAEKKGGLYKMAKRYVDSTDPAPDPATKAKFEHHLSLFSAKHDLYTGSAEERADFKKAMKAACKDPAMRRAQDEFFAEEYMKPALDSAQKRCVGSALGKAMFYDLAIQSGPGRISTLSPKAMARAGKPGATQVQPCDPNGPTEDAYLKALNEERRDFVEGLGGDAAKSTYREDFFKEQLDGGNLGLDHDFVVRGYPVKGLGSPASAPAPAAPAWHPPMTLPSTAPTPSPWDAWTTRP